jgi:hypothetical protein
MLLHQLSVDRIIIHQIYQRDHDGNKINPLQSHEYTIFGHDAMQTFETRIISALGHDSKAVPMEIVNQELGYLPSLVDHLIDQERESFAVSSYDIANKLADAQQTRNIPGGIVVVFSGKQGLPQKKFLGIIKAEVHSGYQKEVAPETNEISLKFVEELLLTPGTRLYKTAGFFEKDNYDEDSNNLNDKWAVMVSDYQINKAEGKAAAKYFYSDFLGCGYPRTSARITKQFYESTKSFIANLNVSQTVKSDILNALTTYLKVEASSAISASEFAERYFDTDAQDAFTNHIEKAGLPSTAFTKDIEHIKSMLKVRKVRFNTNIKIIGPSEAFKELVNIESMEGDPDDSGATPEWTKVIIKDRISEQE